LQQPLQQRAEKQFVIKQLVMQQMFLHIALFQDFVLLNLKM
jgi:hypothetical protein